MDTPQNLINELTDRVSALTADVSRLTRERDEARASVLDERAIADELIARMTADRDSWRTLAESSRIRAEAAEAAGKEVVQTAEGLLSENKRLKAEVNELARNLALAWFHLENIASGDADLDAEKMRVEELRIEARNNLDA